jgi:hypothetical protein
MRPVDTAARALLTATILAAALAPLWTARAQTSHPPPQCQPDGRLVRLPGLPEASGVAVSRRVPGRLWVLNDSGQPLLFALDARGSVTGRISVPGAVVEDWEAVSVGPCPAGSCVYVADIGDNEASRRRVTIYRVPEPGPADGSARAADAFHATYPDGAHDAETLLVTPDARLFVVTKGNTGPVTLYAFPRELHAGETTRLERISRLGDEASAADTRITDGSVSQDGRWVVLRTGDALRFYDASELFAGTWREVHRVTLDALDEPQGEGVASGEREIFLVGESGGRGAAGTFGRLACGTT